MKPGRSGKESKPGTPRAKAKGKGIGKKGKVSAVVDATPKAKPYAQHPAELDCRRGHDCLAYAKGECKKVHIDLAERAKEVDKHRAKNQKNGDNRSDSIDDARRKRGNVK